MENVELIKTLSRCSTFFVEFKTRGNSCYVNSWGKMRLKWMSVCKLGCSWCARFPLWLRIIPSCILFIHFLSEMTTPHKRLVTGSLEVPFEIFLCPLISRLLYIPVLLHLFLNSAIPEDKWEDHHFGMWFSFWYNQSRTIHISCTWADVFGECLKRTCLSDIYMALCSWSDILNCWFA
jgi:hypothetical protein